MTSVIAMLVAAASDLLPNVNSKLRTQILAEFRFESDQAGFPPLLHAYRDRHIQHLRTLLRGLPLTIVVDRVDQA